MVAAIATKPIRPGDIVGRADERIVMNGVSWESYETQLAIRGDRPVPRISFLDGAMELMSPSRDHERIASYIGRLIESFALARGVELSPYGSWTLKAPVKKAGVEPDECYIIGEDQSPDTPHLVIEVIWTSGGIEKLEAYRRLDVPEVWFWEEDVISIYVLRAGRYEPSATTTVLPGLDVALLASFLEHPTMTQAVRAFVAALSA